MKIKGIITFNYKNNTTAKLVYNSLEKDNEGFLKSKLENSSINYELNNEKLGSFLTTADDLIASEILVEKITKIK